uniref:Uncharacterized protein n=1 Tax=Arundo donax TaxID=35708 RepID=A0A0A9Q039_ARUDO
MACASCTKSAWMHGNLHRVQQINFIFCRDFMHIVLVHYLEVKVISDPALIAMYLATYSYYYQIIGYHHSICCSVGSFMLSKLLL